MGKTLAMNHRGERKKKGFTLWQTNIAIENGHRNSGFTH